MNKPRNYGIDLLRVFSMYMVVVQHLLLHKGIYSQPFMSPTPADYIVRWMMYIFCYCAVNCFALISGYVSESRYRFTFTPLITLWLRTFFYTFIITALFAVFLPEKVGKTEWLGAFFPVYTNQYWYISSYYGLLVLIPFLNLGLNTLSNGQIKKLSMLLIAAFSVFPTLFPYDVMNTASGFSVMWLIVMYILGVYLRRRGKPKSSAFICFVCYVSMSLTSFAVKMILSNFHGKEDFYELAKSNLLVSYTSPTMVGAAVFLLLFFIQLDIPVIIKKVLDVISPLSLGVYIIHTHPLIWLELMPKTTKYIGNTTLSTVLSVIVIAAVIYTVCTIIEILRSQLFKLLKVQKLSEKAEIKISQKFFQ